MAKRKGAKAHRKNQMKYHHPKVQTVFESIDTVLRSAVSDEELEASFTVPPASNQILSPADNYNQTPKRSLTTFEDVFSTPVATQNYLLITPVNKSVSRYKHLESFNCTNLNSLFKTDSPGENLNMPNELVKTIRMKLGSPIPGPSKFSGSSSSPNLLKGHTSLTFTPVNKKRSLSALGALHTPSSADFKTKSSVGTQTMPDLDQILNKSNVLNGKNLLVTPKLERNVDVNVEDKVFYKTPYRIVNEIIKTPKYSTVDAKLSKILSNFEQELNSNPIQLKNIQSFNEKLVGLPMKPCNNKIAQKNQNSSFSEASFFSPELYYLKSASTPLEKALRPLPKVHECREPQKENPSSFVYDATTPKCNEKKEMNARNSIVKGLNNSDILTTPKLHQNVSKLKSSFIKNDIPKPSTPIRHKTPEKSENVLHISGRRYYTVLRRIRRFHTRYTLQWTLRILKICSWFGFTIRQGISSLYQNLPGRNTEKASSTVSCDCESYKLKYETITEELRSTKNEVDQVKSELSGLQMKYDEVMRQVEDIRNEMKKVKFPMAGPSCLPPLPPPPPPPPPLMPLFVPKNSSLKKNTSKNKDEKKSNENSRPQISLQEILNVKLKKTSEKKPLARSSTQPLISKEMLSQIKLRPTTMRPHTAVTSVSEVASQNSSISLSPHTNLTRLLTNVDSHVRLKRLKRIGKFSFDTLSRKGRTLNLERERSGIETDNF